MPKYTDIFFDLDRTLIDFDKSAMITLRILYEEFFSNHNRLKRPFEQFLETYNTINPVLWEKYRKNEITKEYLNYHRFKNTFDALQLECSNTSAFAEQYVILSSQTVHLISGAIEVLDYLYPKYHLHIITNGFQEVQEGKLSKSGLKKYFKCIITSEEAGCMKPDREIFEYALKRAGTKAENSLMVGDDFEVDIIGAAAAGIDQVYIPFPSEKITNFKANYVLENILGLKEILL